MKQSKWDGEIGQSASMPAHCDRAEALVAYLYGEENANEAKSFEQHLERCRSCQEEFAAFSHVRHSLGEWRTALLDAAASAPLNFTDRAVSASANTSAARSDRRMQEHSTLVALRQLFDFSPLWLRAASLAALLLICMVAGFSIINFERGRITASRVTPPAQANPSPQNREVSRDGESAPNLSVRLNGNDEGNRSNASTSSSLDHKEAASSERRKRNGRVRRRSAPSPAAAASDQLLTARDEREAIAREESDLPQLYDLLDDRQMPTMDDDNSPRLRDLLREVK